MAIPLPDDAIESGWPQPMALLLTELLPVVGEGVTGPPVIGPVNCPNGGSGAKIGAISAAGPGYIFNPDGIRLLRRRPGRQDGHAADRRRHLRRSSIIRCCPPSATRSSRTSASAAS